MHSHSEFDCRNRIVDNSDHRTFQHKSGEIRTRVAGNWRCVTNKPAHLDAWPVSASHPMGNELSTPVSSFNRMRSAVNHACASKKEIRKKA